MRIHNTFVLLYLFIAIAAFGFSVRYWFESSYLNLEMTPPSSYLVEMDGTSIKCTSLTTIKWRRGEVDWVSIKDLKTKEEKRVLVVGVHDLPPKVNINFPEKVGLGEYTIAISIVDDWDSTNTIVTDIELDGEKISDPVVNTFFLHSGSHIIRVKAVDSFGNVSEKEKKFEVYIGFPAVPKMMYKEPNSVVFPDKPDLCFLYPLEIGRVNGVGMLSRDTAKIARKIDEFGNLGEVFVLPPVPRNITPISKKIVITSITNNLLLLSGGSPFPIIGKVILPENRLLAIGEKTLINMTTGQLIVKGTLMNISPKFTINGGSLRVSDGGQLYLNEGILNSTIEANRADVVFLKNVNGVRQLRAVKSKYVVLENMTLDSFECTKCKGIYIKKSTIGKIHISNSNEVILQDSTTNELSIELFTKGMVINSNATSLTLSTLSKLLIYRSKIENSDINTASTLMVRESKLGKVSLNAFSLMESFLTEFSGKILTVRSEVIRR